MNKPSVKPPKVSLAETLAKAYKSWTIPWRDMPKDSKQYYIVLARAARRHIAREGRQ